MEFEKKLNALEETARKLESGVSLEEGISLYEQSLELTKECLKDLTDCKGKLTVIKKQMDALIEEPFKEDDL